MPDPIFKLVPKEPNLQTIEKLEELIAAERAGTLSRLAIVYDNSGDIYTSVKDGDNEFSAYAASLLLARASR